MSAKSLEERIKRLEDIEAIKDLLSRYAHCVNKGWRGKKIDYAELHLLFAADVHYEIPDMDLVTNGLDELASSLRKETERVEFSMHAILNPRIEIVGNRACATCLMWIASRFEQARARAVYMSCDVQLSERSEGWRIDTVRVDFGEMISPEARQ